MKENNDSISRILTKNHQRIEDMFANFHDLALYSWRYGPGLEYTAFSVYLKSITKDTDTSFMRSTLQDLVEHELGQSTTITVEDVISFFNRNGVSSKRSLVLNQFDHAVESILDGNFVIFFNQWNKALSYEAFSIESRQVNEPITEAVVQGPREGTVEDLKINVGLLRARLRNTDFKLESFKASGKTKTEVVYGYLDGAVNPKTLAEFKRRMTEVKKVEILETSFVEEMLEDSTYSPFPQYRYTERPDVAVSSLLEGKIIVLVQGTGSILICPGLFTEFFQASEDYYQRTLIASSIRLMRIIAFFIALTLPGVFISFKTYHPELIPTVLLLTIVDSREGIPFPTIVEAFIMLFFFELLREAGVRLPKPVGSAVSIVGALVIGDAAINAGIASPIMVVIVALTGIASFSIPQYTIAISLRLLQIPLMLMAGLLGMFGVMIGLLWIILHLTTLRTLEQPYLSPLAPLKVKQIMDVFIRAPLKNLLRSPRKRYVRKE